MTPVSGSKNSSEILLQPPSESIVKRSVGVGKYQRPLAVA